MSRLKSSLLACYVTLPYVNIARFQAFLVLEWYRTRYQYRRVERGGRLEFEELRLWEGGSIVGGWDSAAEDRRSGGNERLGSEPGR